MASNVFTKKQILQNLASRGCFIDIYTLDAFFARKKVEAIFEDPEGNEFYDNNALNLVLEGLFNNSQKLNPDNEVQKQDIIKPTGETNLNLDDKEAFDVLNNISLSDGTPLVDKLENVQNLDLQQNNIQTNIAEQKETTNQPVAIENSDSFNEQPSIETKSNPVDDDMFSMNSEATSFQQDETFSSTQDDILSSGLNSNTDDSGSFDDITLLSESFEAQEKLRQYVMSELSKNNGGMDMSSQKMPSSSLNNEFKLDISERTLNMIARTMAKKIAKYVGSIMAQDAKQSSKVAEYEEENKKLTQKARELEEQNRKLRLLLAESNKNLNSYKPSFFGLYKKVDPKQNKK